MYGFNAGACFEIGRVEPIVVGICFVVFGALHEEKKLIES